MDSIVQMSTQYAAEVKRANSMLVAIKNGIENKMATVVMKHTSYLQPCWSKSKSQNYNPCNTFY